MIDSTWAVGITAVLLSFITALAGIMYRSVMSRLKSLEEHHREVCISIMTTLIALHPTEATHIVEGMENLFVNGKD